MRLKCVLALRFASGLTEVLSTHTKIYACRIRVHGMRLEKEEEGVKLSERWRRERENNETAN